MNVIKVLTPTAWAFPETDPETRTECSWGVTQGKVTAVGSGGDVPLGSAGGRPGRTLTSESPHRGLGGLGIYTPTTTNHWSGTALPGASSPALLAHPFWAGQAEVAVESPGRGVGEAGKHK